MKYSIFLFFILVKLLNADVINIKEESNNLNILPYSLLYIDKTQKNNFEEIEKKDFKENSKDTLLYSMGRDFNLWIKFTLQNTSNKKIEKIIALDYSLFNEVLLYGENNLIAKDGALNKSKNEVFVKPTFLISLDKDVKKTYYMMINTKTAGLVVNLKSYKPREYEKKDFYFQVIISFFFGAMSILSIYNLFLYLFTKDKAYLYYVLYMFSMIFYEYIYLGFSQVYFLTKTSSLFVIDSVVAFSSIQLIFVILFAREFLKSKSFVLLDKILIIYIYISIIISIFTYKNYILDAFIVVVYFPLFFILIYLGIKSYKNNPSLSILYLLGWSTVVSAWSFTVLYNAGFFNVFAYLPYYVECAILFEASIFSIALAKRINILKDEKYNLQSKLMQNEQNEKKVLEEKVSYQTKELRRALKAKEFLFNELHHRVKNNMQMVVSLMRLQANQNENEDLKSFISVAINRVQAISVLHELLYNENNLGSINVKEYFSSLIRGLKNLFKGEIEIHYEINSNLNTSDSIYCGLIINELVSNSFKHAFITKGNIYISLKKKEEHFYLSVKDDGKGYTEDEEKNLGLLIISTLVKEQLKGTLLVKSNNGVTTSIVWRDNNG